MKKFQEMLYNKGENGDDVAAELYLQSMDYNDDELALWVAENDKEIRDVLGLNEFASVVSDDTDGEIKGMLKEYNDLRNNGLSLFKGDKKLAPSGKPMKTLDDFMGALGVGNGDYNDNDRAAFSNPSNSAYWKNMTEEDRTLAALSLGYDSAEEMGRDIERVANGFQRQNQVEGWGPNNERQLISWVVSALKGAATPRIKEAQLAGRDITWQDVTGDLAELGLNFIPGVGIGRIAAKIPGVGKVANRAAGSMIGQGAGLVADQFAVPFATQAIDAGVLYNPDVAGVETSGLNPRSKVDWNKMAAQASAIAGAKGAVKGAAMVGKNMLEQGLGNEVGGGAFREGVKMFESIGEKTDDLIKRRQAMLDRKAELAKKRENVTLRNDDDISTGLASTDDLINAENFRILNSEAERIANSKKVRDDYRKAVSADEAVDKIMSDADKYGKTGQLGTSDPYEITKTYEKRIRDAEDAQAKYNGDAIENVYRKENENSPYPSLLMLEDGRVVPRSYLTHDGNLAYPGANYSFSAGGKLKPLDYKYDDGLNRQLDFEEYAKGGISFAPNKAIDESSVLSRNPAVLEQIQKDELLKRKLDPSKTAFRENARDVTADAVFNALARDGVVGNVSDFDKKREDALWNRVMIKMRPLTANSKLSPETRKKNADAILNVMQYGLDGLPTEIYKQNPRVYKLIADNLEVKGWRHPSEESNPQPTTSYSSAY
jgi:hypothetical protein